MDRIITTRDLKKSFRSPRGSVDAVRGVSIDVARGEIFGFLGPNGAGKTTTLRMLTTLLPIDGGTAVVAGYDVAAPTREGPRAHRLREPARRCRRHGHRTREPRSSRAASTAPTSPRSAPGPRR